MQSIVGVLDWATISPTTCLRNTHVGIIGQSRDVGCRDGEGHGELARRIGLACKYIDYRVAALLTRLPSHENCIGHTLPRSSLDDVAHVEDHDNLLASLMEVEANIVEKVTLHFGEVEVVLDVTIGAFTSLTAKANQSDVGTLCLIGDGTCRNCKFGKHRLAPTECVGKLGSILALLELLVVVVEVLQFFGNRKACIGDALHQIDGISLVHITRTCSTCDEVVCGNTEYGHVLHVLHRQSIAIILEQYHTFSSRLTSDSSMFLQIRFVAVFVAFEARSANDVLEDALGIAVEVGHRNNAIVHALDDAVDLGLVTWFHKVVAGNDSLHRAFLGTPVGHHDALEAPLVAQNGGEQSMTLLGEFAIDLIVGRHHGPGISLLHGNLEALEINLTQSTLAHYFVDKGAVGLLRIHGEVLDRSADALALDATNVSSSNLACYQRIFGIVLEIASAKGRTMNVHTRSEQNVATVFEHLVANAMAYAFYQFGVPCASQSGSYGKSCSIIGVGIALACGTNTHTGRTIGQYSRRNTEARDGTGSACCTWNKVGMSAEDTIELLGCLCNAVTYAKGGFLLKRHCLEDFIYVVGIQHELLCRQ